MDVMEGVACLECSCPLLALGQCADDARVGDGVCCQAEVGHGAEDLQCSLPLIACVTR